MKYVNKSFTMPVCGRPMTDLQYDLAVGKITQAQYDLASGAQKCSLVLGDNTICDKPVGHAGRCGKPQVSINVKGVEAPPAHPKVARRLRALKMG